MVPPLLQMTLLPKGECCGQPGAGVVCVLSFQATARPVLGQAFVSSCASDEDSSR
jgi:hypothetical protein